MSRQTPKKNKRHVKTNLQSEQQATQGWAGRNANVRSAPMLDNQQLGNPKHNRKPHQCQGPPRSAQKACRVHVCSTLRMKMPQQNCTMNTHLLLQIMKLLRPTPASARRLDDANSVRQTNPLDQQPTHMWPLLRRAQSSQEVGVMLRPESQSALSAPGTPLHNAQTPQES